MIDGRSYLRVVGEAGSAHSALRAVSQLKPQIALVSASLPGITGVALIDAVSQRPGAPFCVLMVDELEGWTSGAPRDIGICGIVDRSMTPDQICAVLRGVSAPVRELPAEPPSREDIRLNELTNVAGGADRSLRADSQLSSREMEVLDCVIQGLSNKQIAKELFVTEQTVKNHMTSVFRKLQVHDRVQALLYAVRHGWVSFERSPQKVRVPGTRHHA
ncbi:response regulator transcription factor [soil metagenome]